MTIAIRGVATQTDITGATRSPVVTKPSGVVDGDLILLFCETNTVANFASPVAGFTIIGAEVDGGTSSSALYYKIASGEPTTWTLTNIFAQTEKAMFVAIAYSGVDQANPINAVGAQTFLTATALSGPSCDPTVVDCMIVQFAGTDPGAGAFAGTPDTSPVGTERFDSKNTAGDNAEYIFIQEWLSAGTHAAIALDVTGLTSASYTYHQIAIAPVGAITYTKAGGATSPLVANGMDVDIYSELSTGLAIGVASGSKLREYAPRYGEAVLSAIASGADVIEFVESGLSLSELIASGADVIEFSEIGVAILEGIASGQDEITFAEIGVAILDAISSGADVIIFSETATGIMRASGSGFYELGGGIVYEKSGLAVSALVGVGNDTSIFSEGGVGASIFVSSGIRALEFTKIGGAVLIPSSLASDIIEYVESGMPILITVGSGISELTYQRNEKAGVAILMASGVGVDAVTLNKSGIGIMILGVDGSVSTYSVGNPFFELYRMQIWMLP